jgi:hypothetical protein
VESKYGIKFSVEVNAPFSRCPPPPSWSLFRTSPLSSSAINSIIFNLSFTSHIHAYEFCHSPWPVQLYLQSGGNRVLQICTHRFSSVRSPFFTYWRESELVTSQVQQLITGLSNPRDPMCQSTLTFLFPLSGLRLYRDFATRDTKHSVFQLPSPDVPKRRYDPIAFSQPRVLVTWSTQYLGSHPANSRVREISRSLPPVFHSLLRSHTLPCGCRDIASLHALLAATL